MDEFIFQGGYKKHDIWVLPLMNLPPPFVSEPLIMQRDVYQILLWVWEWDFENIVRCRAVDFIIGERADEKRSNESYQHRNLKYYTKEWLIDQGYADAAIERGYPNGEGVADVVSKSGKIGIECGRTDVRRLIHNVYQGITVGWAPYEFLSTNTPSGSRHALLLIFSKQEGILLDECFSLCCSIIFKYLMWAIPRGASKHVD